MGTVGNSGSEPRPNIICLEGNGSRPSHRGNGWSIGGAMFTLNQTEVHAVCYAIDHVVTGGGIVRRKENVGTKKFLQP